MLSYGIFSPVLGIKQDFPTELLQEAYTPRSENIVVRDGEVHRCRMREEILDDSPNSEVIIHYERLTTSDGTSYTFAFTGGQATAQPQIFRWDPAGTGWAEEDAAPLYDFAVDVTLTTGQTKWSTTTFGGSVIATNGTDKIIRANHGSNFAILDTASGVEVVAGTTYMTACEWVCTFENYLLAMNTYEGGVRYPRRVRWAGIGTKDEWLASEGGGTLEVPGNDRIIGAAAMRDHLIIFKERSIHKMYLTPGDTVWEQEEVTQEYGCISPFSAVLLPGGELVFLATDKTIRTTRGESISGPVDDILRNIPTAELEHVQAIRMQWNEEIYLSIPYGSEATTCNKIITLSRDGAWGTIDMAVAAFGKHVNTATTSTIIDNVTDYIDDVDWPNLEWTDQGFSALTDIGSDYGEESFSLQGAQTDNGNAYDGWFTLSTSLSQPPNLAQYKRLVEVTLYARRQSDGTLEVAVRPDGKASFQSLGGGSVDIDDATRDLIAARLPCDVRGRHFEFKITGTQHFEFLGMKFDHILDGVA